MQTSPDRGEGFAVQKFEEVDALRAALTTYFPGHTLDLGPQAREFRVQIGLCPLDKMLLYRGNYHGARHLSVPNSIFYGQAFPIQGEAEVVNNRVATICSSEYGAASEPGELGFSNSPEFDHFVTLINPDAISATVAGLIGKAAVGPLKLDRSGFGSRPAARLSRSLVTMLFNELGGADPVPQVLVAELQQSILIAFICGNSHNYSHLFDRPPAKIAPWQTRRVEEYIVANWDQPISIEALAVVSNASVRSVFNAFRIHRGCTPMGFVKKVRLEHSRELLRNPHFRSTVTDAALSCGFGNLGHFASDYRKAFGETPSETLRRAKRSRDI